MRYLLAAVVCLLLVACGAQASKTPSPTNARHTPASSAYHMGQMIPGPSHVTLTVTNLTFDPGGSYFPENYPQGGRWASLYATMHNGGTTTYAAGSLLAQSMALDFQIHDSDGSINPSGAQHDPGLTGPILPGATATGWLSFAVPASGSLRLVWVPAGAVIDLTT